MPSEIAPSALAPSAPTASAPEASTLEASALERRDRPGPDVASLAEARRCLEGLDRALRATRSGDDRDLDARRVRADLAHLRESLALLSASVERSPDRGPERMVEIPDTPYDPAMWRDADDEGIGCNHHHR